MTPGTLTDLRNDAFENSGLALNAQLSFVSWATLGQQTTFTDAGLNCGWDYFCDVSATDAAGEFAHAGWIKGSVNACSAGSPPYHVYLPSIRRR